jgi:transcriptional regulator
VHPNRAFHWTDEEEMLAFVGEVSFATICAEGPAVVHAPLLVAAPDRLLFHVSRANRAVERLEGARAIASVLGPDCYISPDWYESAGQVPTWNYVAVEAEGPLRRLDQAELADSLDGLSRAHEERLAPKPVWTRDKMAPGRFEAMLKAIAGFELKIEALRGTRKLGQHKGLEDRRRVAEALAALGRAEAAELMRP